ncbi:MAG: hypothetical protein LBC72_03135 [Spirochaetaceae bacterium]|jgi:chromosome segregation ATPase|nr:hypothetical protein [Spirochaetaceae bacterium]
MKRYIGKGLTFKKVMAAIQATRDVLEAEIEANAKRQAVGEKEAAERRAVWEKEAAERKREAAERKREDAERKREADARRAALEEQMKRTDKRIGEITNRFGDIVEHMVLPNLVTKFEELGFTFTKANRTEIKDRVNNIFMEIDALLENGDKVMAVEIKTKPSTDDVDDHINRMEKLRFLADLHNDTRGYLGGIAGVVFGESQKIYALKKGLFVVEPSGETFKITAPEGDYRPYVW